jgi:hypothetical protein
VSAERVILVHLRRPRNRPDESRSDPFWEFGSFGCTGCHRANLMHPRRIDELVGARLGFAQGGHDGFRLVHLTPPVRVEMHAHRCEARWSPAESPFRYASAPILVRNDGATDFPRFKRMVSRVARSSWESRLSSAIRTRRAPMPEAVGAEIISVHDARRSTAVSGDLAIDYWLALPKPPPMVDRSRRRTYEELRRAAGAQGSRRCR